MRPTTDRRFNAFLERKEKRRLDTFLASLAAVMATPEGRFVIWHWLDRAGIRRTVWDASGMQVHFNAGQQDFGFRMLADVMATNPAAADVMNAELREWDSRMEKELAVREQQATNAREQE